MRSNQSIKLSLWLILLSITFSCKKNPVVSSPDPENYNRTILSFKLPAGQVGNTVITHAADSSKVTLYAIDTVDMANIKPNITVSDKATVSPASGEKINFAANGNRYTYTVTSASGMPEKWYVEIKIAYDSFHIDNTTPATTITWNSTATKISHNANNAEYGRVHRVNANTLLLTYQFGNTSNLFANSIGIRRSTDNGVTWGEPTIFSPPAGYGNYSGAETYVLKNGMIIMAYVGLANPDDNAHDNVQIRTSTDAGSTWSNPQIVAYGRSWEPGLIQLPSGEIELFYSSEAAWWPSANVQQQILMIRSFDNATTWTAPMTVAYTSGVRDGMPVPLVLQNNRGIVFPVESVGNSQSAWMSWSSLYSAWKYESTPGSVANGRRWLATIPGVWGGAPYLVQAAAGQTILSVQDAAGRAVPEWRKNTMIVMVGNTMAKNFTHPSYPWPNLPTNEGAIENSMFLKDSTTIVAVSSRIFADGHSEVYWKEGQIH